MSRATHMARSGRPPSQRQLRVGEQVRHVLSELLARGEVRDPDVADHSITVTEVRVSPDLRNATAFIIPLGNINAAGPDVVTETIIAGLRRAAPFLRGRIGKELRLRYAPQLTFVRDDGFDRAARIDALLGDAAPEQ